MDAEDGDRESSATGRKLNWCCCIMRSIQIQSGGRSVGVDGGSDGASRDAGRGEALYGRG